MMPNVLVGPGRPSVATAANQLIVRQLISNSGCSIRTTSRRSGIKPTSVWKMTKKTLKLWHYRLSWFAAVATEGRPVRLASLTEPAC